MSEPSTRMVLLEESCFEFWRDPQPSIVNRKKLDRHAMRMFRLDMIDLVSSQKCTVLVGKFTYLFVTNVSNKCERMTKVMLRFG